jgi:dolichol-phosphate mannosyltransferase
LPDPRFSLVVPTYNEAENIGPLLDALRGALSGVSHEIIVADDDSPDRTWELAERWASRDGRGAVKVLRRTADKGLSAAVVDGFGAARGALLGVMDADLSHDPALWPRLLAALDGGAEVAVGSRRVPGGGADRWPWHRRVFSGFATLFSRTLLGLRLRDPMSGFFAVRREVFTRARPSLHPKGYKILLEIVVKSGVAPEKVVEVPFIFKDRQQGYSKLTGGVMASYLSQNLGLLRHRLRGRA